MKCPASYSYFIEKIIFVLCFIVFVLIKKKTNTTPLIHATLAQEAHKQELKLVLCAKINRRLMYFPTYA